MTFPFILFLVDTLTLFTILGSIAGMVAAIAYLIVEIYKNKALKRRTKELNELNPDLEVLKDYKMVWTKILGILNDELGFRKNAAIKNIGLDLEKILPDLDHFIHSKVKHVKGMSISYYGLIIDPESDLLKPLINENSNIKTAFVTASYERLQVLKDSYGRQKNFHFEVRPYRIPPLVHGILVNEKHLFLGFTEIKGGKLFGSDKPYIYMKLDDEVKATVHYFNFYNSWFDYYWEHGKK